MWCDHPYSQRKSSGGEGWRWQWRQGGQNLKKKGVRQYSGSLHKIGEGLRPLCQLFIFNFLRVVKANDLNEDVSDLFKTVNNRDLQFYDTVTYKEGWLISLFAKDMQNMDNYSKDLKNASTQHMLTPRKVIFETNFTSMCISSWSFLWQCSKESYSNHWFSLVQLL